MTESNKLRQLVLTTSKRVIHGRVFLISISSFCIVAYLVHTFLLILQCTCNSDMANMVLEANDIVHGNIFLKDWILTGITFFTTDLLFFELGTLLFGVSNLAYAVAFYTMYLAMITAGMFLFFEMCPRDKRFLLPLFVMLAVLPSRTWISHCQGHMASAAWSFFAIWSVLRYFKSARTRYLFTMSVFLVLATAGDISGLLTGGFPIVLVCMTNFLRSKFQKNRYLWACIVSCLSLATAVLLEHAWLSLGGADKNAYVGSNRFLPVNQWSSHFYLYIEGLLRLCDADFTGKELYSVESLTKLFRSLFVLIGFCCIVRSIRSFLLGNTKKDSSVILSLSFITISSVYVLTSVSVDLGNTRYFAYAPIVLSLVITEYLASYNSEIQVFTCHAWRVSVQAVSVCLIALSIYSNKTNLQPLLDYEIRRKSIYDIRRLELADFLAEHGLTSGYAQFWNASVITVYSKNNVRIRQICPDGTQQRWFCKNAWYAEPANFVITNELDENKIESVFGSDYERLICGDYIIWVYDHDIALFSYRPRPYSFNGNNVKGGQDKDGRRTLEPGGCSYGPYWTVLSGSYKAVIEGENIGLADIELYSDFGETHYPFSCDLSDGRAELSFTIPRTTRTFELVLKNNSEQPVIISSLILLPEREGNP